MLAEHLVAEEINAFAEVDGGVLVEGLDGATPGARHRWWRGRFLKCIFHPRILARERKRRKVVTTYKEFMKKGRRFTRNV
jgi:hypothetical protein